MFAEQTGILVIPGLTFWHLVAAIVVGLFAYDLLWDAYDGLRAGLKRLVRWWESRPPTAVEDATADPMAQRPTSPIVHKGTFIARRPPGTREWTGEPRWVETTAAVHSADCKYASRGQALHFIVTVDELREMLERTGKRACRHCDPLEERDREDTGEHVAVST